ncbi:LIM domain protein, partial [Ostertagia ostertagi]
MIGVMQSAELVDLDEQSPTYCEAAIRQQFTSTSAFHPDGSTASPVTVEESVCAVCGYEIKDQFVLKVIISSFSIAFNRSGNPAILGLQVMSDSFHECCLRCVACNQNLSNSPTCFSKDGRLYCREDHSMYVQVYIFI